MINKKMLFISIFILMIVLSIGAVSAEDADDAIASTDDEVVLEDSEPTASGSVSGGVDVVTENPWDTNGELSYDIPADAKTIKSADVYVNVYGGTVDDKYALNTNTTIITDNNQVTYNQTLHYKGEDKTQVYTVNENTTKSNLDYMIHYDITNLVAGLNGTNLVIKVNTTYMEGSPTSNNIGNIKLIGLVLTYDDGDEDIIKYWINDNQIWTNTNTTLTFDTTSMADVLEMNLINIALDSADATYKLNGEFLTNSEYAPGNYYRYNKWDVTDYFNSTRKTEFLGIGGQGSFGVSHKQALAVLTAKPGEASASLSLVTERDGKVYSDTKVPIVYPGLSNKITITVDTNKKGNYVIKLLADGEEVNSTELFLTAGTQKVTLIDPTPRPINSSSVYTNRSGTYNKVNYTVQLFLKDELINKTSIDAVILYNGYFNKALYDQTSLEPFYNGTITGDIFINVSDFVGTDGNSGKYASGTKNRADDWNVTLKDGSVIVKAFIYVPYTSITGDNINMLNATFNDQVITPVDWIRDQSNAVGAGGYGVLVYDVTDYIVNGNNSLALNRTLSGGIYPSTLIYLTNTTGSNVIKEVYISNCADLLGAYGNGDRQLKIDSTFNLVPDDVNKTEVYVFAAGTEPGRASVSINGVVDDNAFNTTVKNTVSYYSKDITDIMADSNNVSLILNKGMFTALQQIVVVTKNVKENDTNTTPVKPADNTTNNSASSATTNPTSTPAKTKQATKIVAKKKTFKAKKKVKKYTITLKAGKKPVKKVQVTIKIGKKTYKAKTNAKGKAVFKIKLTKKGTYKAKISFKGNANYKASSKTVKIIIK
jgi:hypothetical protein